MVRRPPTKSSILIAAALLVALVGWTWLTFAFGPVQALDARWVAPPLDPLSPVAQVASALSLLTWPGVTYAAMAGIAVWAFQRRLRQLAVALGLMIVATWSITQLLKISFGRARPEAGLDLISVSGYAYPSGHMSSIVAGSIAVGATFAVTRRSVSTRLRWQIGAGLLVILVAVDQWILGAHYLTDIVGGMLLGGLTATLALLVSGVEVPVGYDLVTEMTRTRAIEPVPADRRRRAAVIYNPTKVTDWVTFRRHVEYELRTRGWDRPLWLETSTDDPGRAMTEHAVAEGVDLVLGAGGDGTIRAICSGLAGSGVPFGLIPAGTGNLLARNIGIPLDEAAALDVAFDGLEKEVDLVTLSVDGGPADHFAVMAGIGIDAVIMEGTDPMLKRTVGNAAYFVSAAQNARHPALQATIRVDDGPAFSRKAHVIVIGNVGFLQGKIQLIPNARADDGLLDVLVASPRGLRDWVRLTTQVLTRQKRTDRQLDRLTGRKVSIKVDGRDQFQMDGDTVGECSTMTAEVQPGALRLRVPRESVATRPSDKSGTPAAPVVAAETVAAEVVAAAAPTAEAALTNGSTRTAGLRRPWRKRQTAAR